jgi:hypothetical protein
MQIRIHDPATGKHHVFNVRPFDQLTVADWYTITNPPIAEGVSEMDATYELIQRWASIPKRMLRRMPPSEVERLVTALGSMLGEATKAKMDDFTPEATFAHDGITYSVPQNIEADTTFGQWADLNSRLEGMTTDADMLPVICAVLLVPEGQEYEGSDLDTRIAAMRALPAAYALKLTAFFFRQREQVAKRHEPVFEQEADLRAASASAGAERVERRYGWFSTIYRLAQLKPILVALFGDKGEVVRYSTTECLTVLSYERDSDVLQGRIQERYQKLKENQRTRKR